MPTPKPVKAEKSLSAEDDFRNKYVLDRSNSVSDKPSRQTLINADIHSRLQTFVYKCSNGKGKMATFLNNILAEFIQNHEEIMKRTVKKFNNEDF